jgi:uncharacterized protein
LLLLESAQNPSDPQQFWREQAIACLEEQLSQYRQEPTELQLKLQPQLDILKSLLQKLQQPLLQIAVFGWVSRGKSALLNALFDEVLFPTGPLHGVTQWPRSVRWTPQTQAGSTPKIQLELTDTPGLDEMTGEARAAMAQSVAQCADLLLFVSAGQPSPAEQQALIELTKFGKPLLLILNKADLYPDLTATTVYQAFIDTPLQTALSPREIILTAAAPAPVQVRHEWPDGQTTVDWEMPPPQVADLRQALLELLNREGLYLLVLNTLQQAQKIEVQMLQAVSQYYQTLNQSQQWSIAGLKSGVVGLSPWPVLDLLSSFTLDAIQIRRLGTQLHIHISDYSVKHLMPALFKSLLWVGGANLASAIAGFGGEAGLFSEWLLQGVLAGYSALQLKQTAQQVLQESIPFQPNRTGSILQSCLKLLTPDLLLYRFSEQFLEQPVAKGGASAAISRP